MCPSNLADNRQFSQIHYRLFNFSCIPILEAIQIIQTQLKDIEFAFQASFNLFQRKIVCKYYSWIVEISKYCSQVFARSLIEYHAIVYGRSALRSILWFIQDDVAPSIVSQDHDQELTTHLSEQGESVGIASISFNALESSPQRLLNSWKAVPLAVSTRTTSLEARPESQRLINVIDLELYPRML